MSDLRFLSYFYVFLPTRLRLSIWTMTILLRLLLYANILLRAWRQSKQCRKADDKKWQWRSRRIFATSNDWSNLWQRDTESCFSWEYGFSSISTLHLQMHYLLLSKNTSSSAVDRSQKISLTRTLYHFQDFLFFKTSSYCIILCGLLLLKTFSCQFSLEKQTHYPLFSGIFSVKIP